MKCYQLSDFWSATLKLHEAFASKDPRAEILENFVATIMLCQGFRNRNKIRELKSKWTIKNTRGARFIDHISAQLFTSKQFFFLILINLIIYKNTIEW